MSRLETELRQPLPVDRHLLSLLRRAVFHRLLPTGTIAKKQNVGNDYDTSKQTTDRER